jgi:putative addiction module component (TIGR02574 family)
MASDTLARFLRLPPQERTELALALWESLDDADRDAAVPMTPELTDELDRRWQEHVADPGSSVPGEVVERRLKDSSWYGFEERG